MVLGIRLFGGGGGVESGSITEQKLDSYESLKSETLDVQSSMDVMIERCQSDTPSVLQILSIGRASSSLVKKLESLSEFVQNFTIKPLSSEEDASDYLLLSQNICNKSEMIVDRMIALFAPMESKGALKYVKADIESINKSMRKIVNEMKIIFPQQHQSQMKIIIESISKALGQLLAKYDLKGSEEHQ